MNARTPDPLIMVTSTLKIEVSQSSILNKNNNRYRPTGIHFDMELRFLGQEYFNGDDPCLCIGISRNLREQSKSCRYVSTVSIIICIISATPVWILEAQEWILEAQQWTEPPQPHKLCTVGPASAISRASRTTFSAKARPQGFGRRGEQREVWHSLGTQIRKGTF